MCVRAESDCNTELCMNVARLLQLLLLLQHWQYRAYLPVCMCSDTFASLMRILAVNRLNVANWFVKSQLYSQRKNRVYWLLGARKCG